MNIDLKLVTKSQANELRGYILGVPTDDRILVVVPKKADNVTASGIIIPDTSKEDLPKKATIVLQGRFEDSEMANLLDIGNVITYGLYAGKEVEPMLNISNPIRKREILENYTFRVISCNEIIFVEPPVEENNL